MEILFISIFIFAIILGIFSIIFIKKEFSIYLYIISIVLLITSLLYTPFVSFKNNIQKPNIINKDSVIVKDSFLIIYNNKSI
nr:MAG TPA: hypothetical protein [Caudoviricetes sp.]